MLHDGVLEHTTAQPGVHDRRDDPRVPCPSELSIVWHHDLDAPGRYPLIDASDGGLRIRSHLPMAQGMTGMVLRLLPEGRAIDRGVIVRWLRRTDDGRFDIGLAYL